MSDTTPQPATSQDPEQNRLFRACTQRRRCLTTQTLLLIAVITGVLDAAAVAEGQAGRPAASSPSAPVPPPNPPAGPAASSDAASPLPQITAAVPPDNLVGLGLTPDHYDATGYPESSEGLLIVELHPDFGPITFVHGARPHYLEAQFINTQRDGVFLARNDLVEDVLPNGQAHEIPYGYGAIKRSMAAITLVEAQIEPHLSDNQKLYETFPLQDVYLGATLSLTGLRGEIRYVNRERFVGYGQVGLNLGALAGLKFNRTYATFAVPVVLGGGIRYPSIFTLLGSHWTSGAEFVLGIGKVNDDPDTDNAIALPGLFHEFEWAFKRDIEVTDYRADARPHNYGVQSFFAKLSAYADFFGGASNGLRFDIHVGYRYNFLGPTIPAHAFKETKVTYASDRYAQRKREEERRRRALEGALHSQAQSTPPP